MKTLTVHLHEDGTIRFINTEGAEAFLSEDAVVRRASHVVPVNRLLRGVFQGLRNTFGEKGWMAAFTRVWPCEWYVDLSPIGRPALPQTYKNRAEAISAEVEYLNATFI